MTEDNDFATEVETTETTDEVDFTTAVVQIAGFVAATAGVVYLTRKVMDRFDRKKATELDNPVIDVTSREV